LAATVDLAAAVQVADSQAVTIRLAALQLLDKETTAELDMVTALDLINQAAAVAARVQPAEILVQEQAATVALEQIHIQHGQVQHQLESVVIMQAAVAAEYLLLDH